MRDDHEDDLVRRCSPGTTDPPPPPPPPPPAKKISPTDNEPKPDRDKGGKDKK